MPELPEVETIRAGITPFLDQRVINEIKINRYDLRFEVPQDARQTIQGQTVKSITRHGKYLQVHLSNSQTIVWHMGMSGSVKIYQNNKEQYVEQKHDHIILETSAGAKIVFNDPRRFGMFYTLPSHEVTHKAPFSQMGPDATKCTPNELYESLKNKKSPIKTALLDQEIIAGLGNIYVCEALYQSNISPLQKASSLEEPQIKTLLENSQAILAKAIEKGGSSLKDHRLTDGSMGYFQNFFHVYGRKGLPCTDCTCDPRETGGIAQIKQAGRSTFYCPQKQRSHHD